MEQAQEATPLTVGTTVGDCLIERVLDVSRYSARYLARVAGRAVILQEFLPRACSLREGTELRAREPEDRNALRWWLRGFLEQSQTLAGLDHPALPRLRRTFEANGTAYAVSEPLAGETLEALLEREGTIDEGRLRRLLLTVLDGLERCHAVGLLHRDIRPANLLLTADGRAVLTDFAVLRAAVRLKSGLLTGAGLPPYAAPEDLSSTGPHGAWTDLYGLGATAYRAVCGVPPPSAYQRRAGSLLIPAMQAARIPATEALLRAIDSALALAPEARPQSIAAWRAMLQVEAPPVEALAVVASPAKRVGVLRYAVATLLIALAGAGYWWQFGRKPPPTAAQPTSSAMAAAPAPTSAAPTADQVVVATVSPTDGGSVRTSSLDQLALDLMARDRKSQDAAREQQRLEELQARQQREAAKLAASAQSRPSADASGRSPARPESALPVPAQPAATASDDDQALKSEVERLRAELKARQSGDPSKPAAESGAVYRQTMITLVGARLRYPAEAQASLEEGSDMVRVRVQRNGLVLSATVVQRSGYPLLDSEAEAVFSRIGRFAPVPADISPGSAEIDFTLPIRFKLADN